MTIFSRCFSDLVNFRSGNVFGKDTTHSFAIQMNFQHDLSGSFTVFVKKFLNYHHDKLHGRVVIIQQNDLVHLWGGGSQWAALQNYRIAAADVFWFRNRGSRHYGCFGGFGCHTFHFIDRFQDCAQWGNGNM